MYMLAMLTQMVDDGRLTLKEILADIPHDPAAIFMYVLTAIALYAVWWGNRQKPEPRGEGSEAPEHADSPGATKSSDGVEIKRGSVDRRAQENA